MKLNRLAVNIIRLFVLRDIKKRRKKYPPHNLYRERLDIPFIKDGLINHQYDVYLANENNRKRICLLDIHGGSYMFCTHQDNYHFATKFLERGYDVVSLDYLPNNGKRDTLDLVDDIVKNINHLFEHLIEYDLQDDIFFISGDSAGGHFALLISEMLIDKKIQDKLKMKLPDFTIKGVLVNSPVYDFANDIDKSVSRSGMKRLFGKHYTIEKMELVSPKTYIDVLNIPIFLSTCKKDFLRMESLKLKEEVEERKYPLTFVDIDSDEKNIIHVHNVIYPDLKQSKQVNEQMFNFIEKWK